MFKRLQCKESSSVTFYYDGEAVKAFKGDTVSAALLCAGTPVKASSGGAPYCQMGSCFGCLVNISDQTVQACLTEVAEGLQVLSVPSNGGSTDE